MLAQAQELDLVSSPIDVIPLICAPQCANKTDHTTRHFPSCPEATDNNLTGEIYLELDDKTTENDEYE